MDEGGEYFFTPPANPTAAHNDAMPANILDLSHSTVYQPQVNPAPTNQASTSYVTIDDDIEDEPELVISAEEDNLHVVLAMNEAMSELIDNMIEKAEASLHENLEKQRILQERKKIFTSNAAMIRRKVPVLSFMPPYFKDNFGMCPPHNSEMRRKQETMVYDPLLKEEKRWTASELRNLHQAVRAKIIEERLMPIYAQRDLTMDKLRNADITTTAEEREEWNIKIASLKRKIEWEYNLPDKDLLTGDYSRVDWASIAMVTFKGTRSPHSLRLKWVNEQSPQWSKADWTAAEVKRLSELARENFVSWSLIAEKLGTKRTPWQCFEKYKSEISNEILKREWSKEEDERLVKLVESLQLNGVIQWDKVTYHMAGRTRQQCRMRYLRTLDKNIKHGRWTDEEDLLLMCSVGRYGAKDWLKVAKGVPGRSDGQCRERWVNVLDCPNRRDEWSMEEDEKLLYAVKMFGKGSWSKISTVIPERNPQVCRTRFKALMRTKMRICASQLSKIREAQVKAKPKSSDKTRETFAEFNRLLGGNDETGKEFCERNRVVAGTHSRSQFKTVEPEVRRVVEEGIKNISAKYQNGKRTEDPDADVEELFDDIADPKARSWMPVEFDSSVTEEERCRRLTEALCQVVEMQDQQVSLYEQERSSGKVETEIKMRLRKILEDKVRERVEAAVTQRSTTFTSASFAKKCAAAAAASTSAAAAADGEEQLLPPTPATTHAAELIIAELPRLSDLAVPLLQAMWMGEGEDPVKAASMEEVEKRLEKRMREEKEYVEMKEILRGLLLEPLSLVMSIEDDRRKSKRLHDEIDRMREALVEEYREKKKEEERRRVARDAAAAKKKEIVKMKSGGGAAPLAPFLLADEGEGDAGDEDVIEISPPTPAASGKKTQRKSLAASKAPEAAAAATPAAKKPAARGKKEIATVAATAADAEEVVEEEDETSQKKSRARPARKTPAKGRGKKTGAEEAPGANQKEAGKDAAPAESGAEEAPDAIEKEEETPKKTPAKGRKAPAREKKSGTEEAPDAIEEELEDAAPKKTPARGRKAPVRRSTRGKKVEEEEEEEEGEVIAKKTRGGARKTPVNRKRKGEEEVEVEEVVVEEAVEEEQKKGTKKRKGEEGVDGEAVEEAVEEGEKGTKKRKVVEVEEEEGGGEKADEDGGEPEVKKGRVEEEEKEMPEPSTTDAEQPAVEE